MPCFLWPLSPLRGGCCCSSCCWSFRRRRGRAGARPGWWYCADAAIRRRRAAGGDQPADREARQARVPGHPDRPGRPRLVPGESAGRARQDQGPAGPAMCVVPAETPAGPLAPFERRVVAHVALRAGARGEVPAPALSDGFEGGETEFMKAFREEVEADARQRGLTRPRLSGRRIGLLCAAAARPGRSAARRRRRRAPARRAGLRGRALSRRVRGHHRRRDQPAPQLGRAGGAGQVAFGRRGGTRRRCWPGRLQRRGTGAGLRGRPRCRAGRSGGLRPGRHQRGMVQLSRKLAADRDRDKHVALAAGHPRHGDHHRRPRSLLHRGDLARHARHGGAGRRTRRADRGWAPSPASAHGWRGGRCSPGSPSSTAR